MLPILSVILFTPLVGALFALVIPREDTKTIRRWGLLVAGVALALSVVIWAAVMRANADASGATGYPGEDYAWIAAPALNIHYKLGADGLNAPLVFLTTLATMASLFYSTHTIETRVKEYVILFLVLETSLIGVFLALDLALFYVFWTLGLLPPLLLIGVWGGEQRERAALQFFLYNLAGSIALLLVFLAVYSRTETFDLTTAAAARPFADLPSPTAAHAAFLVLFAALAVRLPVFPFHIRLADAQTQAPSGASAMMGSAFLGAGGYGLIRIALPLFPEAFHNFVRTTPLIPTIAVISIVYGAFVCLAQWNLKRLIAHLPLVGMGFVALGASAAAACYPEDPTAAAAALNGAAMQVFAQGLIVGALFLLADMLYERTRTYDLKAYGGLGRQIPHYYSLMLIASLGALSLPGLVSFWGVFFVFKGAVATGSIPAFAFVSALGLFVTAGCVLWKIVQHIFLGKLDKWEQLRDMTGWEKVTVWPLILLIVALGLYPAPLLDMFNAALTALLNTLPR